MHDRMARAVAEKNIDETIMLLKVLGNAGHPKSLKPITKVLPIFGTAAASLPTRVHVDAILAMRNIAKKEPRLVRNMSMSREWGDLCQHQCEDSTFKFLVVFPLQI